MRGERPGQGLQPARLRHAGPRSAAAAPQLAELMLDAVKPTQAEQQLTAGPRGLQARVQQATDEAAAVGAALSVAILDRKTHQLISTGNSQVIGTASVAKLFIADDLLLHESEGKAALSADDRQALDVMLQSSDDGAAERFWGQGGANAIVTAVAARYGLTSTTPPSDGRWWNTMSSTTDLIRYYEMLLDGSGGLPADKAKVIVDDLAQSTPTGSTATRSASASPTGSMPNRWRSSRAGCAASAAIGCTCRPVWSARTAATSWWCSPCSPPTTPPPATRSPGRSRRYFPRAASTRWGAGSNPTAGPAVPGGVRGCAAAKPPAPCRDARVVAG